MNSTDEFAILSSVVQAVNLERAETGDISRALAPRPYPDPKKTLKIYE